MNLLLNFLSRPLSSLQWGCFPNGFFAGLPLPHVMALVMALATALTACGPGTGGTGVGPISGTYVSVNANTAH